MNDFVVSVDCKFVESESDPAAKRYVFAYTITIENHSEATAQLLNRYWCITDGAGDAKEVRGPGVVGKQPTIEPSHGFRYTSAAMIETPVGSMEGSYEFQGADGNLFAVAIPCFTLAVPNMVH